IRDLIVTGVQTCALPICSEHGLGIDGQVFRHFDSHSPLLAEEGWLRRQPAGWRRRRGGQFDRNVRRTDHPPVSIKLSRHPSSARRGIARLHNVPHATTISSPARPVWFLFQWSCGERLHVYRGLSVPSPKQPHI